MRRRKRKTPAAGNAWAIFLAVLFIAVVALSGCAQINPIACGRLDGTLGCEVRFQ